MYNFLSLVVVIVVLALFIGRFERLEREVKQLRQEVQQLGARDSSLE